MTLKKVIAILLTTFLMLGLCACDLGDIASERDPDITTSNIDIKDGGKSRTITIKNYNVSFTVSNDFQVDMEDTELDVFCTDGDVNMGAYGYFSDDLAEGTDLEEMWEIQCEADLERFKNVRELSHEAKFESSDKELKTSIYSCESGILKLYMYYIYAKPKSNDDTFLWLVFSGMPSEIRDNFDEIEDIVDSIKFN